MAEIEKEIVEKFRKIQENIMHNWIFGDENNGNFNWKTHFEQDKKEMNEIINKINDIIYNNKIPELAKLNSQQKMFHILGYIPRDSEFTYPMNCFLYHYIKKYCPNVKLEVARDGSIYGALKNNKTKNNVCLNAHMDLINVNRENKDRIVYGAFGKNIQYSYEQDKDNSSKIYLKRKNPKTPLGADDGKGVATILNILKNYNPETMPNLSFFLSTVEENELYSMKHFVKNEDNIKKLFPENLNNIAFLNLDAFEGKEIDLYSNQSLNLNNLEKDIIKLHKSYVEKELNEKSTQSQAWTDPMSDAFSLKMGIKRHQLVGKLNNFKSPLLISLGPTSLKPHSIEETIDIVEFDKFQKYIQNDLLKMLANYKIVQITEQQEKELKIQLHTKEIKKLREKIKNEEKIIEEISNPELIIK